MAVAVHFSEHGSDGLLYVNQRAPLIEPNGRMSSKLAPLKAVAKVVNEDR
jgi:hypothetical protein